MVVWASCTWQGGSSPCTSARLADCDYDICTASPTNKRSCASRITTPATGDVASLWTTNLIRVKLSTGSAQDGRGARRDAAARGDHRGASVARGARLVGGLEYRHNSKWMATSRNPHFSNTGMRVSAHRIGELDAIRRGLWRPSREQCQDA